VQTAITLLNPTGGKIVSALASCPSVGEGRLKNREDPKLFHHAKEHSMTLPATEWYKERALACSHAHISVDLIVAAPNPIDVASVAPLPRYTGGHVVHATSANKAALHRDVVRSVTRTLGFEAVFRIRNPPQLGTINFFGHFYVRGNDMLALPVADEDACYAIQFNLQTSLSGPLHVQTALLYTNHARERRIRVFTFPVESSQSLARVYNKADAHTMASIMFKTAIDHSVTNSFQACVANMNDRFVKSLRTFKAMVSGAGGRTTGTLVLPDALRLLPAYLNGYQRMPATRFCSVIDTAPDARVTNMCLLAHANPDCAVAYCTPSIHCVYSNRGDLDKLPRQEIVSIEAMKHDSVYLVELPGSLRCLWYGRSVETKALEAFGIPSVAPSDARGSGVATEDEEAAIDICVARFRDLVARLDRLSCGLPHTPLHFVAQGSSGAAAGSPNNSFAQGTLTSPSRISQGPGNAATAGSPKTPGGSSFGVKVVTERTLLTRMLEEEAKEAVSFTSYLAFLMRRSNTAE
jgi:protein transport protein SEC24